MARILQDGALIPGTGASAGGMRERATIVFSGSLDPERFVAFAEHRARRLDLAARLGAVGAEAVAVTVEGEPDLIDAFEMACSLGPATCVVRDVARGEDP